jgi:hypothetical protein
VYSDDAGDDVADDNVSSWNISMSRPLSDRNPHQAFSFGRTDGRTGLLGQWIAALDMKAIEHAIVGLGSWYSDKCCNASLLQGLEFIRS